MTVPAAADPAALIRLAQDVLERTAYVPADRAVRAAVVIGRQALEAEVDRLYATIAPPVGRPSMRSKLVIVRECVDRGIGERARAAWDGLSHAAHQHAYEFQPSTPEVRELLRQVRTILEGPTD